MRECFDESMFAWDFVNGHTIHANLSALSPSGFSGCRDVVVWPAPSTSPCHIDNRGFNLDMYFAKSTTANDDLGEADKNKRTTAILHCRREDDFAKALALPLTPPKGNGIQRVEPICPSNAAREGWTRLTTASLSEEDMCGPVRTTISLEDRFAFPQVYQPDRAQKRQLLLEVALYEYFCLIQAEPAHAWNEDTLVMTPPDRFDAYGLRVETPATIGFYYSTTYYSIEALYTHCTSVDDPEHNKLKIRFAPLTVARDGIAGPLNSIESHTGDVKWERPTYALIEPQNNGLDIFCMLGEQRRLGRWVQVLQIGHSSQLADYMRQVESSRPLWAGAGGHLHTNMRGIWEPAAP